MVCARVSNLPHDDLVLVDRVNHQLHILKLASEAGDRVN
jgi:hypothetical protein